MATQKVGEVEFVARINTDELEKDGQNAEKIAKQTADGVEQSVTDGMNKAAKALAVAGAGLTLYAKNATDFTVDLVKSSKSLGREIGTSTEEASRMVAALGRMGISSDQASTAFGIFSKNINKATESTEEHRLEQEKLKVDIDKSKKSIEIVTDEIKKNGDKTGQLTLKLRELNTNLAIQEDNLKKSSNAFEQLGLSTTNADGTAKGFNTILLEVSDKFKGMPDGITKTALSMELFGRSGKDMIPILNQGSEGIKRLEEEADRLGLTLSGDTITKIDALIKSQKDLKQQTDALKIAVGTATAPVLTAFNTKVNQMVGALLEAPAPIREITTGLLAFGGPVAGAASGLIGFAANMRTAVDGMKGAVLATTAFGAALVGILGPAIANVTGLTNGLNSSLSKGTQELQNLGFNTQMVKPGMDALKVSEDFLRQATDMVTAAQQAQASSAQNLTNANLALEGANLSVEQAQLSYNDAIKRYGPDSLQARQAALNLKQANEQQKTAVQNAAQAVKDKAASDAEVAKKEELKKKVEDENKKLGDQEGLLDRIGNKISNLGKKAGNKLNDWGSGALKILPGFAEGVKNFAGGMAVVGERGPELVHLPKGTDVIPNEMSRKLASPTAQPIGLGDGNMGSQPLIINVNLHDGIMTDSTVALRNMGTKIAESINDALKARGAGKNELIGGGML